jgi:hypothetical protein
MSSTTSPETGPVTIPRLARGQRLNQARISSSSARRSWNSCHASFGIFSPALSGIADQPSRM